MENKIKVLLVSPYSAKRTGGIGTWSKTVIDYSKKVDGIELRFLNTATSLPKRQAMNNRVTHLIVGAIDSMRILFYLFWRMLTTCPDVVHYTSSAASALYKDFIAIWIVKKIFKKKFIIHWHFGRIPSIFKEKGKEYKLFVKICNKADISIALDERSYKALTQEEIKTVEIPNPIPNTIQYEAERLSIQDSQEDRNEGEVLFVGHVLKEKGVYELVQACAECTNVKTLIVVGPFFDDCIKKELQSISEKRDGGKWLHLMGEKKRKEVLEYYKKCSVFCLPSYSEGFPYVILEAMAFGCPIVATKVGAIPEMLSDGCGVLVDVKNIEKLKLAIDNILCNKNKSKVMGRKAHARVLTNYTIESVFKMYYNIWTSV